MINLFTIYKSSHTWLTDSIFFEPVKQIKALGLRCINRRLKIILIPLLRSTISGTQFGNKILAVISVSCR